MSWPPGVARGGAPTGTCHNILTRTCCENAAYTSYPLPAETPRNERIALRVASSGPMRDCVGTGYVIGRDDEAAAKSRAAIDAFLARTLSPAT